MLHPWSGRGPRSTLHGAHTKMGGAQRDAARWTSAWHARLRACACPGPRPSDKICWRAAGCVRTSPRRPLGRPLGRPLSPRPAAARLYVPWRSVSVRAWRRDRGRYSIYSQLGSARRVVTRVTRVSRHVCVVLESCGVTVRSVSGARLVRGDESAQREVTSVPMRVIFASSYCGILITIV